MSDILNELRELLQWSRDYDEDTATIERAAAEIERLRADLVEACDIALGTDLSREVAERIYKIRANGQSQQ